MLSALAARLRDLAHAVVCLAPACTAAAARWGPEPPRDPAAWLYAVALRHAWDRARRAQVAAAAPPDVEVHVLSLEEIAIAAAEPIPDERLRLMFTCCHPALDPATRVALTLRTVCGLMPGTIARAFLVPEATLAQRLLRGRRKIRDAGVPFEPPGPRDWPGRLAAVVATLEIAYAEAHGDAALAGDAAEVGLKVVALSAALAAMLPDDAEVLALAAMVRIAEARRGARMDGEGAMVPLDRQDMRRWDGAMLAEGEALLARAAALPGRAGPYQLIAAIHAAHASRRRTGVTPWGAILAMYEALRQVRAGRVVEVNRAVALAEVAGPEAGLTALADVEVDWLPFHAAHAECLARAGRAMEARAAYVRALALHPPPAEALFLQRQMERLPR